MSEAWNGLALQAAMDRIALHLDELRSAQQAGDLTLVIQAASSIEMNAKFITEMTKPRAP